MRSDCRNRIERGSTNADDRLSLFLPTGNFAEARGRGAVGRRAPIRRGVDERPFLFSVRLAGRAADRMLHDGSFLALPLIHISEPTRLLSISYAVSCLEQK